MSIVAAVSVHGFDVRDISGGPRGTIDAQSTHNRGTTGGSPYDRSGCRVALDRYQSIDDSRLCRCRRFTIVRDDARALDDDQRRARPGPCLGTRRVSQSSDFLKRSTLAASIALPRIAIAASCGHSTPNPVPFRNTARSTIRK